MPDCAIERDDLGEQIHAWIDDNGHVMCPHCNLEMGHFPPDDTILECGGGHWIYEKEIFG